jgi:beta-galactosidase
MLGVCYYPEHWPEARWAEDARLMRECGLEIVRIGEFAWSRIEPREGSYDWDWLDRAIATLAAAGLKLILGTPTATPPAWLTQRYPETLRVGADGRRWSHGGRRHTCPTHPRYRELSARIVRDLSERYGEHPAVVAWQIDNELGNHSTARCACDSCRQEFQRWCQERYHTLDRLNTAWGAVFWSQSYSEWSQIPLPSDPVGGGHNPSLQIAYRRFASDAHVDLLRQQATILRRNSPGRTLTTNIAPLDDELDWHDIAAEVDVISWDNYPHGFEHPADVAFFHDLVRGLKQQPFWVMEQQAGQINWTPYNPPVPPGQVRLWTYQALAHGAENVIYFRWRACRYGQEQYHSGLLKHDTSPAQGFYEAQQVARELAQRKIRRAPAAVALLISYDDFWTTQVEPHTAQFDYWRMARAIYRDFWQRGINVDVIRRGSEISQYQHVIPVAPLLIDDAEARRWRGFVEEGGRLTLTIRSFVKDQENVWSDQPLPHGLTDLIGAQLNQWYALPPQQHARLWTADAQPVDVPIWIEDLALKQAGALLRYQPDSLPGIDQLRADAERTIGERGGSVRYLGTYPPDPDTGLFSGGSGSPFPSAVESITLVDGQLLLDHETRQVELRSE